MEPSPSPSVEPSPSPSPGPTAGNDPVFTDFHGNEYKVDGEAGRSYNLISAPGVSVNAHFQAVPRDSVFTPTGITDTTMGSLHVRICGAFDLQLDVASGAANCSRAGRAVPCAVAANASGVQFTRDESLCSLDTMDCAWVSEAEMTEEAETLRTRDDIVRLGMTRLHLAVPNVAKLQLARDLVVSNAHTTSCGAFTPWPAARRACDEVAMHQAAGAARYSNSTAEKWLTILRKHKPHPDARHYPFTHVTIRSLGYEQREVHGLLGQRAIEPPRPPPGAAIAAARGAEQASSAGHGAHRALVSPTGSYASTQGEGYIEGSYTDYEVPELHHHAFRFGRLGC